MSQLQVGELHEALPTAAKPAVSTPAAPATCRLCGAEGVDDRPLPCGDVASFLDQLHRFCGEPGFASGAHPLHEVAARPQATAILRLSAGPVGAAEFEPLTTPGVPLATR